MNSQTIHGEKAKYLLKYLFFSGLILPVHVDACFSKHKEP